MTWRGRRAFWRGSRWAAAAVALALGGCSRPVALVPGEEVEGRLEADGRVIYGLDLAAGDYVRVRVAPAETERLAELSVAVSTADDRLIIEATGIRSEASGVIAWIAPVGGEYRLQLDNPDSTRPLHYRVTAEEARPSRPDDHDRAAAEQAAGESVRLLIRGEPEQAADALTQALAHWRRVGEVDPIVPTLLDLADLRFSSDREGALALVEEAIGLGADTPNWRIEALQRKGKLLKREDDCAGALAAMEEAKTLALAQGDLAGIGSALYQQGWILKWCRSLDRAKAAFDEALDYARRAGDESLQALCHREFAMMAKWRGDLATASEQIGTALALVEASGNRQVLADVLHEHGNIDKTQGKLAEAREHYQRCLELNESLARVDLVIPTLMTLGTLSLDLLRPEEARDYFDRALHLAADLKDLARVADAERELGAAYERMRAYGRAEQFYRKSLATAERIPRESSIASALLRLGKLLVERDRFREAIPLLTAALERQRSFDDQRELPLTLRALGLAYGRLGDEGRALEYLREALDLQREHGDTLRTVWTLYRLAQVQAEQDPAAARETIEEAIGISQKIRRGLGVDSLRVDFFEGPRLLYDLYVDLLFKSGELQAAFVANEEGRAQALLDLLIEAQVDPRAGIAPELDREQREIDRRTSLLQGALRDADASGWGERAQSIRSQLDGEHRASEQVEARIRQQSRRYRELSAPTITTLGQVQASLPPKRALLEYWLGTERSYVFIVTRDASVALPLPAERELRGRIERFRTALLDVLPPASFAEEAHALFRELVAPALEIATEATELIIVPDGPLNLLPFEALVTAPPAARSRFDDLAYLIREMEISYAPSATVLATLGTVAGSGPPKTPGAPSFIAFADPDYEGALMLDCPSSTEDLEPGGRDPTVGGRELPRLRGARQEAWRIARPYGHKARVFVGSEATERRVVSDPEVAAAERLHFAVHGVLCDSRPESSGLILTPGDEPPEDGILETREIFDLRLSADLVVLSACETGVGKLVRGEGVVGLTRAFFYAGVPSLVVSLWPVPDRSTADLMTSFYRRLDEGANKAEALRQAKLRLLDTGGGKSAPLYWAPFVLVGSRGGAEASGRM